VFRADDFFTLIARVLIRFTDEFTVGATPVKMVSTERLSTIAAGLIVIFTTRFTTFTAHTHVLYAEAIPTGSALIGMISADRVSTVVTYV